MLFIIFMLQKPEFFGITEATLPARIGFLMEGVWWIGWAQYTFRHLPKDDNTRFSFDTLSQGYK
jgi:MFS transporter, UMF1 family